MSYDFSALSPVDFEELSRDLLQAELKVRLESFATGRDGGIDLRYSRSFGRSWIVQCKHLARSGWSALFSNLRREVVKVRRLAVERYIITTSVNLTPQNKDDIVALFGLEVLSTSDIFGADDLHNLLRRHPAVERAHFKLWLASSAVLEKIFNAATIARTDALVDELGRQVRLYVSNESFNRSLDILSANHVCIIAGVPGIGKTFLARMLMLHHLQQGYEAYVISSDIDEANQLYNPVNHQFFYYDDFLGTAFDESLEKNEDARLAEFLQRVSRAPNKRIVLTTREYILNRATTRYERLHWALGSTLKCVVNLEDYTKIVRGKVLYNHLFFSKINREAIQKFCSDRAYIDVVNHDNFSPRLVEFAIRHAESDGSAMSNLKAFLLGVLGNPATLWEHAFNSQLSASAQTVLLAMLFLPAETPLQDVEAVSSALSNIRVGKNFSGLEFTLELKNLDGTFIKIDSPHGGERRVRYFSPAIADYLIGVLQSSATEINSSLQAAIFFEQILGFWSAAQSRDDGRDSVQSYRYPQLNRWLRNNLQYILQAIERTWQFSCVWRRRYRGVKVEFLRVPANLEANLLKVIEMGNICETPSLLAWAESRVREVSAGWPQSRGDRASAAALISLVQIEPETRLAVREWSLRELEEVDDFEAALMLSETVPDLADSDFESRLLDSFRLFVQAQEQYILEEADDPSSAETAIDEVDILADRLGLDPGWDEDALRDRIADLERQKDDFDYDAARDAHSGTYTRVPSGWGETAGLDLLFDSLERAFES